VPDSLSPYLSPAFYISPPIDNFNSNTIFINNYNSITNTELYTTLAHEGYPGHLYQTTYFYSTNPPLIRHLMEFGGYTEGWATYAELFSYRYLFDKNIASYMASSASYSLGAYCVADIGIHYHGWNLAETTSYLTSLGFTDTAAIEEIYNILISEPANYLKYYVGYLEIQELKNYMKHLYKDNYSDYDFHKLMLDVGPAPFEIIKDYMITQFNSSR